MSDRGLIGRRLLGEIARIHVVCDDCGRSRMLGAGSLKLAQNLGVHTFSDLCRKIRCSECPRQPFEDRNLTISPTWRAGSELRRAG